MRGQRLSELARHVIQPEGIVSTEWPGHAERLKTMGVVLDRWQDGLASLMLAKRANGLYAAGSGGFVMSIPRQTGKTFTVGAVVFALCMAHKGLLVMWTAHRSRTHTETFRSMQGLAEREGIKNLIAGVRRANGEQEIEFANGSRILFGARETGFGRGFAKLDVLVLDEAQILSEKAMNDMVPAMNVAPNGLVLMTGTPPRPSDPSEVFSSRRAEALSGADKDVAYVEFSADEEAVSSDRKQWAIANPSFPSRTKEEAMVRMRKLLGSEASFRREALGIWDRATVADCALDLSSWSSALGDPPAAGRKVYGVKFSPDGALVALAGAMRPEVGPVHVEGIRVASLAEGTGWLVDYLLERKDVAAQIVIDGKAGAGFLVNALRDGACPASVILAPTVDQVMTAHAMFDQGHRDGSLTHVDQPELSEQVHCATKRPIGKSGGYGWAGREGQDVTLLDAVTLAYWGAKVTKRRPGRKGGLV